MSKLIAKQPIMFEGTLIRAGVELPQHDLHRAAAWVKNGAAVWSDDKKAVRPPAPAKPPAPLPEAEQPPKPKTAKPKPDDAG